MSTVDSKNGHQSRKRRVEAEERSPKRRSSPSSKYLTSGTHEYALLVAVTPLRHTQGAILERSLREAGANVLQNDFKILSSLSNPPSRVLVVTDNPDKASRQLKGTRLSQSDVTYVSVKWASAVLTERTWVSHESYVVQGDDKVSRVELKPAPKEVTAQHSPTGSLSGPSRAFTHALPVWYTKGVHSTSDVSEKINFMKSLPSYLCQRCTITQSIYPSPNQDLCKLLELVAEKRLLEGRGRSSFTTDIRARAYRRASAILKCVPYKLKTPKDAEFLHSFGPRVLAVATEFLKTGDVAEVRLLQSDERLRAMSSFVELYGVGYASARKFYDNYKIKNIAQLRESARKQPYEFSEVVSRYLAHYDSLCRTTRADAKAFKEMVEDISNSADEDNLHLRFKICGGFRRGEPSGHDLDLLYCRRAERADDHSSVMKELVHRLRRKGLVSEILRIDSDTDGWGEIHYHERTDSVYPYAHDILHGIAQFKGCKFRLDIVGVRDASEFCFATLAWSGSLSFQRDIRLWCEEQKGWTFGQHGLFHKESGKRVELSPAPQSEIDIFSAIDLTYRPPYERSC